jgi:hypothetical protein
MSIGYKIESNRIKNMIVTTRQIVKRLPTNLRLISVISEAIANSIQANATNIEIFFDNIDISLLDE